MVVMVILGAGVFTWMLLTYRARQRTKSCRWREDRSRDTPEGRYFICVSCGAETFSPDNMPPRICLNPERSDR